MGLLNFFQAGACSEADLTTMLDSLYLATMSCSQQATGNTGHLVPFSLVELNVHQSETFVARQYARGNGGDAPQHGFGFGFGRATTRGVHRARVMVLDFGKWKMRHLIHFLCKYCCTSN